VRVPEAIGRDQAPLVRGMYAGGSSFRPSRPTAANLIKIKVNRILSPALTGFVPASARVQMPLPDETIVAIATAPGRGGIGVVRVSGCRAREVAMPMLRMPQQLQAGRAQFGYLLDVSKELGDERSVVLDEVVVTYFAGPRSYTGEDVVEVAAHGSPVVLDAILRGALTGGARLAEPGEFTERAFLSGRLDLTQAEAVNDLIRSTTLHQARVAAGHMGGAVSHEVLPTKQRLVRLIATLEAGIDFAEDDIDVLPRVEILERLSDVTAPLAKLERSYAYGRVVRDGFRLAIAGRPNAGKSSLFNALVERERSIVTAVAGTTRDWVTETISIEGVPVELMDTAGLREAEGGSLDEAERLGIARSREAMADADVVLLVIDGTDAPHAEDLAILEARGDKNMDGGGCRLLVALSKSDLFRDRAANAPVTAISEQVRVMETSTRDGTGIAEMRIAILDAMRGEGGTREGGLLTNLRQHQAIKDSLGALRDARVAAEVGLPHEVLLMDLHRGLRGLDDLTGTTTSEDILRQIFSNFCIGK